MKARLYLSCLAAAACSGGHSHANAPSAESTVASTDAARDAAAAPTDAAMAAAAAPATPPPPPGTLDETMAAPYFPDAGARFALEDWAGARTLYEQAKKAATDDGMRARATLMMGLCDAKLAAWPQADDELAAAAPALPALADWLRYQEARARYFAHQPDRAAALAKQVAPDSIAGADAELLQGDVLRGGA